MTCTPAVCAESAECAAVHCTCCGPDCPWSKSSQKSPKRDSGCNQRCPLFAANDTVTMVVHSPLAAMSSVGEVQPFFFGYTFCNVLPVCRPVNLRPPTLLSLACALTT
jgi:hypothetical protein